MAESSDLIGTGRFTDPGTRAGRNHPPGQSVKEEDALGAEPTPSANGTQKDIQRHIADKAVCFLPRPWTAGLQAHGERKQPRVLER